MSILRMSTPICLQNHILVELEKSFQDEIITDGGIKFYKDTLFRPEWNATVIGKVASVPLKLTIGDGQGQSLDPERVKIRKIVKPGDEIVFSYLVVMNRKLTDNAGEVYTRDNPTIPRVTTWSNPNGMQIIREYLNNNKYQCALIDTKSRMFVDTIIGSESDAENFMGKYMPTENHGFNYKNLLPCDGKDYWMVDYSQAIAIKRGGIYEMIGDYVLLSAIREPIRGSYEGVLEVYNIQQDTDYRAIGRVVSIGEPPIGSKKISVEINDVVVTDIRYVEKYEIDGKDYWVVRQKYIYGKQSVINDTTRST